MNPSGLRYISALLAPIRNCEHRRDSNRSWKLKVSDVKVENDLTAPKKAVGNLSDDKPIPREQSAFYLPSIFGSGLVFMFFVLLDLVQAQGNWKAQWEKTLTAAKKEGRINIYISGYEKVVPAFQKAYPEIMVRSVTGRGSQLGPRIMAERRAGKYLQDIYSGGSTTPYMIFYRAKVVDSVKSALILPEVLDQSKWWQGKHRYLDKEGKFLFAYTGNVGGAGVHYNTKLVDPKELKSYWDLFKPKWMGKIAARDMRQPGPGSGSMRFLFYNPEIGQDFVYQLFAKRGLTLSRSYRQPTDWVATGRYPICLFCGGISDAKRQGLPVDSLPPHVMKEGSPVSVTFGTLLLMKNAPHPNAARVFINWLLSREGQIALQNAINSPTDELESLREDIPKDVVKAEYRRRKGAKYIVTDRPEWMDLRPVYKLINKALAEGGKR